MGLSKRDFSVLREYAIARNDDVKSQRKLSESLKMSLGSVNDAIRKLSEKGFLRDGCITQAGYKALSPYEVQNAIIMAAGMSTRFAPFSYERPKGAFEVKGEVLVERQIRQLQEAGITDITLVVGYLKEAFFYLEDKYGV